LGQRPRYLGRIIIAFQTPQVFKALKGRIIIAFQTPQVFKALKGNAPGTKDSQGAALGFNKTPFQG